jgi:hypothetical protein
LLKRFERLERLERLERAFSPSGVVSPRGVFVVNISSQETEKNQRNENGNGN